MLMLLCCNCESQYYVFLVTLRCSNYYQVINKLLLLSWVWYSVEACAGRWDVDCN